MNNQELKKLATELRIECILSIHKANSGHTTSSLSCMEILTLLYYGAIQDEPILKHNSQKPHSETRDYFILGKAHAAPALYTILAHRGFFPKEELQHLRKINSMLQGFPVRKIPGIEASLAGPGQGLSIANGIALALKMSKKPNRVYALLGDGELQEGQVWEAALTAPQHKLGNVTLFIDNNKLQKSNFTRAIKNVEPIAAKFSAFGWNAIPVANGHDFDELKDAVRKAWNVSQKPTVIVCETVKGKGVPFAENKANYHGVAFSKEEISVAIPILEKVINAPSR